MNGWELPTSLNVGGQDWKIQSDFRKIIGILRFFNDPQYELKDRQLICLDILYVDFWDMPGGIWEEAFEQAIDFIDMGIKDDGRKRPTLMDWEHDAPVIVPSVNRVIGREVRSLDYLHWWTFLGGLHGDWRKPIFTDRRNSAKEGQREKTGKMGNGIL